ncbi:hypothetical protein OB905_12840 [Halobacteria archaeon AArc-dxtr1]|nr:hypothetical protein [Halobacteria archaeon AArc-dxtr1]
MELSNAIKWTVINRVVTIGALLAATGIVVLGFVLGFWGSIELLIDDPLDPGPAVEEANPIITLVGLVAGFLVWQVGKTYAFFRTLPRASGRRAAAEFDHERVKSGVLDGLDDRLTQIEEDLAETKRSVHELKRAEHAAAFDEGDLLAAGREDSATAADESGQPDEHTDSFTFGAEGEGDSEGDNGVQEEANGSFESGADDDPFSSAETVRPVGDESAETGGSSVGDDDAFDSDADESGSKAGDDPFTSAEDDPLASNDDDDPLA